MYTIQYVFFFFLSFFSLLLQQWTNCINFRKAKASILSRILGIQFHLNPALRHYEVLRWAMIATTISNITIPHKNLHPILPMYIICDNLWSLCNHLLIAFSLNTTMTITMSLIDLAQMTTIFISSQTPGNQWHPGLVFHYHLVCGHETFCLATTSTCFNRNPALHHHPIFRHKILATINHHNVRSPQEMIILRILRSSVKYTILPYSTGKPDRIVKTYAMNLNSLWSAMNSPPKTHLKLRSSLLIIPYT